MPEVLSTLSYGSTDAFFKFEAYLATSTTVTFSYSIRGVSYSANLPIASSTVAGFISAADKVKLNAIADGATANSTDSVLLSRENHTGTQAVSTINGLQASLDSKASTSHVHSTATASTDGFLSSTDKSKLDAVTLSGTTFRVGTSSNPIVGEANGTINGVGYVAMSSPLFGQTDGALFSQASSAAWVAQVFVDYRTGQVATRGKSNDVWQAWRVSLDSSNFNTYAPTLAGVGATGTWPISVSGNAATATNASNLTGGSISGSMSVVSGQSVRFGHANQFDDNDGKIGAGLFGTGLNIIGTQTVAGQDRIVRIWGTLTKSDSVPFVYESGTWGISITGNAATATIATNLTNLSGAEVSPTDFNNLLPSVGLKLDEIVNGWNWANFPPGAYPYGGLFSWQTSHHAFQFYASHAGDLHYRTAWNPGTNWNSGFPWRSILDTGNYNNLVPTLTGTGASGTWNISILGNAATATNATKLADTTPSAFGLSLIDDADAATARTTLGLGSAATQSSDSFATAAHGHAVADVTGLQGALDGKLAAASYTASDVLAKVKTVDGSGSGLDADVVRGTSPTTFGLARLSDADAASARSGLGLGSAATLDVGTGANQIVQRDGSGRLTGDGSLLTGIQAGPTQSALVATTSGAAVDFTGIPSTAKRVTVEFVGVRLVGSSYALLVQLGAGAIEATGYSTVGGRIGSAGSSVDASTDGVTPGTRASGGYVQGTITFTKIEGNKWLYSGCGGTSENTNYAWVVGGVKTLTGTLDRVRISGSANFYAGAVGISWE